MKLVFFWSAVLLFYLRYMFHIINGNDPVSKVIAACCYAHCGKAYGVCGAAGIKSSNCRMEFPAISSISQCFPAVFAQVADSFYQGICRCSYSSQNSCRLSESPESIQNIVSAIEINCCCTSRCACNISSACSKMCKHFGTRSSVCMLCCCTREYRTNPSSDVKPNQCHTPVQRKRSLHQWWLCQKLSPWLLWMSDGPYQPHRVLRKTVLFHSSPLPRCFILVVPVTDIAPDLFPALVPVSSSSVHHYKIRFGTRLPAA